MKALFIAFVALFAVCSANAAPKPASLDTAIALVDKADGQRNEALAKAAKAEAQVSDLKAWGVGQWERAESEKIAKEAYRGSRIKWLVAGVVLGGGVLFFVGLALGSGVLSKLIPVKPPIPEKSLSVLTPEENARYQKWAETQGLGSKVAAAVRAKKKSAK